MMVGRVGVLSAFSTNDGFIDSRKICLTFINLLCYKYVHMRESYKLFAFYILNIVFIPVFFPCKFILKN